MYTFKYEVDINLYRYIAKALFEKYHSYTKQRLRFISKICLVFSIKEKNHIMFEEIFPHVDSLFEPNYSEIMAFTVVDEDYLSELNIEVVDKVLEIFKDEKDLTEYEKEMDRFLYHESENLQDDIVKILLYTTEENIITDKIGKLLISEVGSKLFSIYFENFYFLVD